MSSETGSEGEELLAADVTCAVVRRVGFREQKGTWILTVDGSL